MNRDQQAALTALVQQYAPAEGDNTTAIAMLTCFKASQPTQKMPALYDASLCIIAQGAKEVLLAGERYHYTAADYLVAAVDLPVIGQVTEASVEQPYLCVKLGLEGHLLSELLTQPDRQWLPGARTERGLFVGQMNESLLDALLRLLKLLATPDDIPMMAPLIVRELYYRLLRSDHGQRVAQLALNGSNLQRIAQAIHLLKENFSKPMRVETLAEMVHMSPSSFHYYFKEVTHMSPLQYQKRLRLLEARRLLLTENTNAAYAAYQVGYESSSQFSREYARMFGAPPMTDMERMRTL